MEWEPPSRALDEEERLYAWELSKMLDQGLSINDATELALAHVSWHTVEQLVERGCPPDRVRHILL